MKTALLLLVVLAYFFGVFIWNGRAFRLFVERVSKPYKQAIDAEDWAACDYWYAISQTYRLQELQVVFNPLAWVKYWNWTPSKNG